MEMFMPLKDGSLKALATSVEPEQIPWIAELVLQQMFNALACTAHHKIVHRDIKPDNILYEFRYTKKSKPTYHFFLADFGLSHDTALAMTRAGTEPFMAPEVAKRYPKQTTKVDIWSLFATIVWVWDIGGFRARCWENAVDVHSWLQKIAQLRKFARIRRMAEEDPRDRPAARDLYDAEAWEPVPDADEMDADADVEAVLLEPERDGGLGTANQYGGGLGGEGWTGGQAYQGSNYYVAGGPPNEEPGEPSQQKPRRFEVPYGAPVSRQPNPRLSALLILVLNRALERSPQARSHPQHLRQALAAPAAAPRNPTGATRPRRARGPPQGKGGPGQAGARMGGGRRRRAGRVGRGRRAAGAEQLGRDPAGRAVGLGRRARGTEHLGRPAGRAERMGRGSGRRSAALVRRPGRAGVARQYGAGGHERLEGPLGGRAGRVGLWRFTGIPASFGVFGALSIPLPPTPALSNWS